MVNAAAAYGDITAAAQNGEDMMDLINRTELLRHIDECLAEGDAQTPITNAVLTAVKCAVEQMPRVDNAVEWHKVVVRKMTETDYNTIDVTELIPQNCFICDMPEDDQKILVVMPWGTDCDVCVKNSYGYGLMYESGWHDVIAWAEMPKYEEETVCGMSTQS